MGLKLNSGQITGLVIACGLFVFLPVLAGGQWVKIFTSTACFTLAAMGVGFMYARLGMVSLAQVGLMGLGGWICLRLQHGFGLPFEINLMLGAMGTAVLGMALALPALRMRGLYLALMTLMVAAGLDIVFSFYRFPNGGDGFWGRLAASSVPIDRPGYVVSDAAFLRYCIGFTAFGFLLIELHRRTKPGRAWSMIKRSEAAALASCVNVTFYKTWAFGLSGFLAGLGGGLLAGSLRQLEPATFTTPDSVMLFALVVLGGARYWYGILIAALFFRVAPGLFNNWGIDSDLTLVIFGAGLLHAIITAPDGVSGQISAAISKIKGGRDDRAL